MVRNEGQRFISSSLHDETLKSVVKALRVQVELLTLLAEAEQRLLRLVADSLARVDSTDEHQLVQVFAAVQQCHRQTGCLP